jgi:hypothetical protein
MRVALAFAEILNVVTFSKLNVQARSSAAMRALAYSVKENTGKELASSLGIAERGAVNCLVLVKKVVEEHKKGSRVHN